MKSCDVEGSRKVSQNMANTSRRKDCGRIFIRTDFVHALESKKYRVFGSRGRFAEAFRKLSGNFPEDSRRFVEGSGTFSSSFRTLKCCLGVALKRCPDPTA